MGQITDRYVISLKGSPRREAFFSQPGVADFVVWDAFDGRTGAGRDRFDVVAFERRAAGLPRVERSVAHSPTPVSLLSSRQARATRMTSCWSQKTTSYSPPTSRLS